MAGREWEYSLRVCGPGDEEKLALVGAASFLEAFAGFLPVRMFWRIAGTSILCRSMRRCWPTPETHACVAEVKDAPVGYAVLCPPDMPVPFTPDDIELKRIYLLHRFQGSGIGAALMDWSVETARSLGKRRLLLGVNAENDKAVAFYLRHGFEHAGTRKFQVGNTICSDFILARKLET